MKNPDFAKKLLETCSTRSCNQRGVNGLRNAASRVSIPDSGQSEFFITLLERLNASFPKSLTKNLSFRASLAGEDTLIFESPAVNLEDGMVDFIHHGQGAYKDIWPGGIKAFAASNGFTKVVYRSRPNGATWTLN
jgi:hypothetical protein